MPLDPAGPEWSITATGPTKLRHARALAEEFIRKSLPGGIAVFAPGKTYPGETNPRWAIHLLSRRDGRPIMPNRKPVSKSTGISPRGLLAGLARILGVQTNNILSISDPLKPRSPAFVLPLDVNGSAWRSLAWRFAPGAQLLSTEGPAGLRLPLQLLKTNSARRAVTVQRAGTRLEIFLPPFLQKPWTELLEAIAAALPANASVELSGYVPEDESGEWVQFTLAADPGVIEINLPPSSSWSEYDARLRALDDAQRSTGLRSWKQPRHGRPQGTGGGHHILLGGPTLEENPFFTRPAWLASILRYWQHHPGLSYIFSGCYVGGTSQAPRPDESGKSLWDLEMAYSWLETLPSGIDHRAAIAGTLIHLHSDAGGNTHRSETSFDKFWTPSLPGGARGLVEFRALESLPRADWASALALLWRALAAMLLDSPFRKPLRDFGESLHDEFFLPTVLWEDFKSTLADLARAEIPADEKKLRAIFDWRFPVLLQTGDGLTVRPALESWPLLCETPLEGGNTTRFVDTSVDRLEFLAGAEFARTHRIRINGRALPLRPWKHGLRLSGLRYRRSALHPSLHPGIGVQLPLVLEIEGGQTIRRFELAPLSTAFKPLPAKTPPPAAGPPCRTANPSHRSFDLRIP